MQADRLTRLQSEQKTVRLFPLCVHNKHHCDLHASSPYVFHTSLVIPLKGYQDLAWMTGLTKSDVLTRTV